MRPLVKHSRGHGFWYVLIGDWPSREIFTTNTDAHDWATRLVAKQRHSGKVNAWR